MRILICFLLSACLSMGFKKAELPDEKWLEYKNALYHYKVSYPADWEQSSEQDDKIIYLKSPLSGKYDSLSDNLNILVDDLGRNIDLASFTEQSVRQLEGLGVNKGEGIQIKDCKVAGCDAKELVYALVSDGMRLKFKSVWFIKGTKAYLLTYTSTPDQYRVYVSIIDKMVASFQFTQ